MNKIAFDKMKRIFLQHATLVVLILPVSLVYFLMASVVYLNRIKLFFSSPWESRVSLYHGGRMFEIDSLSSEEQQDFKRHRSFTYINQLTFGCLWEFSKFVSSEQGVPLIDDDEIARVILNSVFCHGLVKEENDPTISWRLPFHLEEYRVFQGFYWDIREIRIHKDKSVSLVDCAGTVHTARSPKWALAKAHAQAQLSFFAPGLAHNHVHFVFPSLVALKVRSVLPKHSVLRQLLEPHTRFTQYINYKALNECQSSSNTGSFVDRWFRPWLSFPIDNDDFLKGIKENCERFYYDNLKLTQDLNEDLPYHRFLKEYFEVVRNFVHELEPLIRDDYVTLSSSMSEFLPFVQRHKMTDVITTLVWNCAVVHYSDHQSYLQWFANKYGCMSVRIPLVTKSEDCDYTSNCEKYVIHEENSSLFADEDIYRTRCFLNTFVQFNENLNLDMTLENTKYEFSQTEAKSASSSFLKQLKELDKKLHKNNEVIVPLSKMVRTVCF